MKVYIVEFLKEGSWISNIISKVTGSNYSHSGMFFNNIFYELDATEGKEYKGKGKEPDYHSYAYANLHDYMTNNLKKERTHIFEVPFDFEQKRMVDALIYFEGLKKKRYGYTKLLRFICLSNFTWFLKIYYKICKKPYKPIGDTDKTNVCSEFVGIMLKKMGWILGNYNKKYTYLSPETTYPGLYAKILKDHRHYAKTA